LPIAMITFPVSGVETYWWLPGLVALAISFFTSTGGLSGAFLLLPFQVSILGFNSPAVSPTNLIFNVFAIPGGLYRYIKEKRMVWPIAAVTTVGTLPGLLIGAFVRVYLFSDPRIFKLFVGIVLGYVGLRLSHGIMAKQKTISGMQEGKNQEVIVKRADWKMIVYDFQEREYRISSISLFLLALIVGVIGGAYGIGGGAIISPFLVAIFGLPVYTVAGAALMGTLVTSAAGILVYQFFMPLLTPDHIAVAPDWLLGLSMGIGGLLGIYLGARLQKFLPEKLIKVILIISVGIVSIRYISSFFIR